jgi:hypothetical protein
LEPLEDRLSPAVLLSTWTGLSFEQFVNKNHANGNYASGPRNLADVNMAAGINYVAVAGTDGVSFINKVTGQVRTTKTFESMFGLPPVDPVLGQEFYLDPTVNFDPQYNQFVVTTLNGASSPSTTALDFALIPDSDPTTFQFARYTLTNTGAMQLPWGDFDHVGWNNDAYFIAINMPTNTPGVWDGSYVMTVPKVDVHFSPPPSTVQAALPLPDHLSDASLNFLNYSVQPAIMHGGPSGQMYFVGTPVPVSASSTLSSNEDSGNYGSSTLNVITLSYSGIQNIVASSFQTHLVPLPIQFYKNPTGGAQQQGSTVRLDVNDTRMLKAEWEGNRLVCTNTVGLVNGATDSAVGWYEFSTINPSAPVSTQEGFLPGPSGTSTFFPSIAIAPDGDLGTTYLESSPSEYLSMYVTGQPVSQYRVVSPLLGYEKMEPYQLVVRSIGPYTLGGNNQTPTRVGDFSNVTPDPVTGDFWAANEWTDEAQGTPQVTDAWDTQVAHFSMFPSVSATQNTRGDPVTFIISANDGTLWEYDRDLPAGSGPNPYCHQISTGQFSAISATQDASGNPVVFAVLSGTHVAGVSDYNQTLWEYNPFFPGTHWVELFSSLFSPSSPFGAISATRDAQNRPRSSRSWPPSGTPPREAP